MKISNSQLRALRKMGERDREDFCNYGRSLGVLRQSVQKLAALGLAEYEPSRYGVTCRITHAGRDYLAGLNTSTKNAA